MSLTSGFAQGLSTPVPVAGAGLPNDLTLYAGGPLDPLKAHEAKYKQLDRMQRMSDRESAKMLAELEKAKHQYYGDKNEDEDLDKVSFVSSHPLLRRQYLLKMAQEPTADGGFVDDPIPGDTYYTGGPEAPFEIEGAGPGKPFKYENFEQYDTPERHVFNTRKGVRENYEQDKRKHQAFRGDISSLTDQQLAGFRDKTTGPIDNFGNRLRYQTGADAGKYTTLAHRVDTERARRDLANYRSEDSEQYRNIRAYPSGVEGNLSRMQDFQGEMQSNRVQGPIPTTAKEYYAQGDTGKFYPEFIRGVERRRVMLPKVQRDIEALKARERETAQGDLEGRVRRDLAQQRMDSSGRVVRNENRFATMPREQLERLRGRLDVATPITAQYGRQEFGQLPEDRRTELGGSFDAYLDRQARTIADRRRFATRDSELKAQQEAAEAADIKAQREYEAAEDRRLQSIENERIIAEQAIAEQEQRLDRDARLEDRANMAAGFANNRGVRQQVNQQRADRGMNTAFRRAQALKDLSSAYQRQLKQEPGSVPPAPAPAKPTPAPEPSYFDRARGFFSDVGDSLKGMGARVIRQGTQGLQQAANYGLRNSEFLEGLIDDDEEARILASLAQGSTGADREMYLKQLEDFTLRDKKNKDRTLEQQIRMDALLDGRYQSLRNMHLEEQARKRGIDPANEPEAFKQIEKDYGPAFDMYYGVGPEAKRLGIKPLQDDSFGVMYGEAKDRFNAFRRAKRETAPEQQAVTDPSKVVPPADPKPAPQPVPFKPLETIPMGDLSQDTQSYLEQNLGTDLNGQPYDLSDPIQLGQAFRDKMQTAEPEAMKALEYMATDLRPEQMTKVLMSAMPEALNLGAQLNNMSDEEAIAYIEQLPPDVQRQIDNFTNFTARFISPQFQGQLEGNPNPTINRVREATPEEVRQHGGRLDRFLLDYLGDYAPTQYIDESKLDQEGVDKIDTEFGYTGLGSGAGKFYIVPGGGALGSTLLYNPQTGEFNREWGTLRDYEELPARYNDALSRSFQQQNRSIGPLF